MITNLVKGAFGQVWGFTILCQIITRHLRACANIHISTSDWDRYQQATPPPTYLVIPL